MPQGKLPTVVAGKKKQRPLEAERASGRWMCLLFSIVRKLRPLCTLPLKLRKPLIVHSMHTGPNSFRMFCRMANIEIKDAVGSEQRPHAHVFLTRNRLQPEHLHRDCAEMIEHGRTPGEAGYCRADIFVSFLPGQPFSRMTRRSTRLSPQDHPLYKEFEVVCEYINKTEPKTCLLENVNKLSMMLLREALGNKYHIAHSMVDQTDWTDSRRSREFIWCLHKDCGSEEVARAAANLAYDIGFWRRGTKPEAVEQHLHIVGTPAWYSVMSQVDQRGKFNVTHSRQSRAWETEVLRNREMLRQVGRPWANEHPLADAKLQGLTGTERQRAVLEAVFLTHCHINGLDPCDPEQFMLAKHGLKWDISQNVHHTNYQALRHCVCSCLGTTGLLYSFEEDRLVHPEEILSSFGWPADVECRGLEWMQIQDLAATSPTVQAIGVSTMALILSCQEACGW